MKLERTIDEAAHSALPPALREAYAKGPDGRYALQLHEEPAPQRPQNGGEAVDLSDEKVRARLRRLGEPTWQRIGELNGGAEVSLGFKRTTDTGGGVWLAKWRRADGSTNTAPLGDVLTQALQESTGVLSNLRRARSLDHAGAKAAAMTWAKEALGKVFPR